MQAGDLVSGKYRLQRLLGAGSMGTVWAARNELTNRDFAIKVLKPTLAENREAIGRFFQEARACGQLRHPAIVDVLDVGHAEDGSPFIVMELLEGEGLDQRLARQKRIVPVDVCRWMAIVARGLDEAHARGLVHRDLKPGNVFFALTRSGEMVPKILDFGIAKDLEGQPFEYVQTSSNSVLGSPAYMSPEQAGGDMDVDGRSDIWSVGVMMYEALTGELPFAANNYNALMLAIINKPHPPVQLHAPDCPSVLAEVVETCLAKDRGKRQRSAAQLAEQLERVYCTLTGSPLEHPERSMTITRTLQQASSTQSTWARMRDAVGSPRRSAGLVLGGVALLVVSIGVAVWLGQSPPAATVRAARLGPLVSAMGSRAQVEFDLALARIHAEHTTNPAMVIDLDPEGPGASARGGPGAGKAKTANTAAAQPKDQHGGVDSAGF